MIIGVRIDVRAISANPIVGNRCVKGPPLQHSPRLPLPKKRPDLVDEGGGGGLYPLTASASTRGSGTR